MSTAAETVYNTNKACCTIPPVLSDYTPKGSFRAHGAFKKVYVTGPEQSDKSIVAIYDIFGFWPQTQQGADIIASTLHATVYMIDIFEPHAAFEREKYPPHTEEHKAEVQAFFGGVARPDVAIEKLVKFGQVLRSEGAKKVGAYGMCWGGKVVVCAGGEGSPFDAVAILHPAMLSVEDAHKLTVPLAIYISKDEPVDTYNEIVEVINKKPFAANNDSYRYEDMHHGWAAARADLNDEENKKQFEHVYQRLVDFFAKNLA